MNHATDSTEATSAAPIDADAPAADTRPPFVIPRDRRKYTRFLSPGHKPAGSRKFESPEHEAFGDGLTFVGANGQSFTQAPPNINYFTTAGGQRLSFGQIVALAGDFYGVPSQPISDGVDANDQQARFTAAFNTLYQEQPVAGVYQAQNILAVMQDQSDAVTDAANQILAAAPSTLDAWSQAYSRTNDDHQFDARYNIASGASDISPWWVSEGSYLKLAAVNWDHFGASAVAAYQAGHACALQAAIAGDYDRAYAMEAFACHYLTDLFSSGHLRTPRKALHSNNQYSDLCSQLMHDEDSYNGLVVQDANGYAWTAYGDKRLNDQVNQANFSHARDAVNASLGEVIVALQAGKAPASFAALSAIPNLAAATNALNPANWSPLYVLVNGEPQVRDVLDDLSCRVWTSSFVYLSTLLRVPGGGVHSPTGAPPGVGRGPAHAISWQNHRIVANGETDLAPTAAVVTTIAPAATNSTPPGQVGGNPGELDPAQQNTLCIVFRRATSGSEYHHLHVLAIPMTDAPAFKTYVPGELAVGGSSSRSSNGGDPAAVALPGACLLVYPDTAGTLCQAMWSASTRAWTSPGPASQQVALLSQDSNNYQMVGAGSGDAAPRVALCNVNGSGLYLAFPTRSTQSGGNIVFSAWNNQGAFATPRPLGYAANGGTVYPKTSLSVSMVEFDGALVLAFADAGNHNAIRVLRNAGGNTWTQLTAAVNDASGQPVTTHSALSLVQYGGILMLVVNDANGNIYTHGYDKAGARWYDYLIQGTTVAGGPVAPLQTKYALGACGYQGNAYVVFANKADGALAIMTTATSA